MKRPLLLPLLLSSILPLAPSAADWPCWRGPDGLGLSTERNLPTRWSATNGLAWTTPIPGQGASSPIVVGDRVYLTTQTPDTGLHVLALDRRSGAVLWDRQVGEGRLKAHQLHNMATPTPVSDGELVWAMFGTGNLACLDLSGRVVWQRDLVKEYGVYKTNHGYGPSPMWRAGRLFIACMHQGPSYLLALEAKTGRTLWKTDRNLSPKDEGQDSYSSPFFLSDQGRTEVVLAGAEAINAYDPASGRELWICDGLKVQHQYGRTISGPTAGDGVLVAVASGFQNRGYTVGIKAGGQGNITATHRLWTSQRFSADCATPVIHQGKLFSIRDDGMASCLNLKTGEAHWQERLFTANVKVSPVAADGKIYFMSGEGHCFVVKAAEKLEMLATNELREATLSTPAISAGHLFIRTEHHLFCAGK